MSIEEPFVLEFCGLPGSGKSTVSHLLAKKLNAEGIKVQEPIYNFDHLSSSNERRRGKLKNFMLGLLSDLLLVPIIKRVSLKLGFNLVYIFNLLRKNRRTNIILDQGVAQGLWSLVYEEQVILQKLLERWVERIPNVPGSYIIIYLKCDSEIVIERLKSIKDDFSRMGRALKAGQEVQIESSNELFSEVLNFLKVDSRFEVIEVASIGTPEQISAEILKVFEI